MGYTGAAFNFIFNAVILNHPVKNFDYEGPYSFTRRTCTKQELLDIKRANKAGNTELEDSIIKYCDVSDYYDVDGFFGKKRLGYKMDLYDDRDCIAVAREYNMLATILKNHPPVDPTEREPRILYVNNIKYLYRHNNVTFFKGAKSIKAECIAQTVYLTIIP